MNYLFYYLHKKIEQDERSNKKFKCIHDYLFWDGGSNVWRVLIIRTLMAMGSSWSRS
jgi:hypothetical protein